jgi:hypothetical protein
VYRKVRAKVDGLAVGDAHAIVVTSTTPSELTLLHELAHFIGGMDHGPQFREVYVGLVGQFVSRERAVRFLSNQLSSEHGDADTQGSQQAT